MNIPQSNYVNQNEQSKYTKRYDGAMKLVPTQ